MLTKRLIICLDVRNRKVTKGVKFKGNIDIGDPVEILPLPTFFKFVIFSVKYQQDMGKVSPKTKEAVKEFYGKNISRQIIKPENLRHIYERHGKYPKTEIKNEQIPINADIATTIPDVLKNPDNVRKGTPTKKGGYETVILSKKYADGSFHIVNAILKNNVLEIYTAYVWNRNKVEKKRSAYGSCETGSNCAIPPQ